MTPSQSLPAASPFGAGVTTGPKNATVSPSPGPGAWMTGVPTSMPTGFMRASWLARAARAAGAVGGGGRVDARVAAFLSDGLHGGVVARAQRVVPGVRGRGVGERGVEADLLERLGVELLVQLVLLQVDPRAQRGVRVTQ